MEEFFTRQVANVGVKLPLYLPDGSKSEHWLRVRGIDSDEFRRAETKGKRKAIEISQIDSDDEREKIIEQVEKEVVASLIAAWSFEQECTHDNVVKFLTEAPQIMSQVNKFAARRSEFFKKN